MSGEILRGDRLRVTIMCTADEVDTTSRGRWLRIRIGTMQLGPIPLDAEAVKIETLAPAEWPPRSGDLWQDEDGMRWFCLSDKRMINERGTYQTDDADELLRIRGPFRLVHRDPNRRTPWDDDEPPF